MASISIDDKKNLDQQAVNNFREYLQIPSVQPDVNYDDCVKFLKVQAKLLALPVKVVDVSLNKPVVVITWKGTRPKLPSIVLSSHMDVVPVYEEKWTQKPFGADIVDGKIYGRGSQDMKCVGIQYLEAIRRLKFLGIKLKRTLNIIFTPDEEIGGHEGMKKFVKTEEFKELNVGFALDEGMASESDEYPVFYGERCIWYLEIHFPGTPGHGSLFHDNTAGEKLSYVLNKFFEFRKQEKQKLLDNPNLTIGDVTTINLTKLNGGVQSNVVPPELSCTIDCRIPVTIDIKKFEDMILGWCRDAGPDVYIKDFDLRRPLIPPTKLDSSNVFWVAFKEAANKLNIKLKPQIFSGATDSRHLRNLGVPVIGFSPMNNTPSLLHDHDEYLGAGDSRHLRELAIPALGFSPMNLTPPLAHDHDEYISVSTFLKGIEIYMGLIKGLANIGN